MNNKNLQSLTLDDSHYAGPRRIRVKTILAAVIGVLLILCSAYALWQKYRPRPRVTVEQVLTKSGKVIIEGASFEAAGWIEPDPFPVIVSSQVPGWITKLHAIEGDKVREGDLLIELYDEDYLLAHDQWVSKRVSLLADLEYQQVQVGIETELFAAEALDSLALAGTRARKRGTEAELKEIDLQIELARRNLERCRISAPIDGVVLRRHVIEGQYVGDREESALLTLYNPEKVQVRVDVNLVDVPKLHLGKACEVRLESAPGAVYPGKIATILHEADNQKNTVQVKVQMIETSDLVKPEMLARVKFLSERKVLDQGTDSYLLYVPGDAVHEDGGAYHVFALRNRNGRQIAEKVAVTMGKARDGDWIEVRNGLDPSSKVITGSTHQLHDGGIVDAGK